MLLPGFQEFKLECSSARRLGLNDAIYSETLSAGGHTWRMACYPHGGHYNHAEYLSLYLELVARDKALGIDDDITAIFDAFLINTKGVPSTCGYAYPQRCLHVYPARGNQQQEQHLVRGSGGAGLPLFADWTNLMTCHFQLDGIVTIIWGVIVVNRMQPTPIAVPSPDMANHLARMLDPDSAVGTDVSFVVGGETCHAHRALLAARSPVFMAELFGPMLEATASSITLHDIDARTFSAMLRFIYTDDLPTQVEEEDVDDDIVFLRSLLIAADRYVLDRLKLLCAQKLLELVTVDTVAATLDLAETYNCPELKSKCLDYVVAADEDFKTRVALTHGFTQLVQKYPSMLVDLCDRDERWYRRLAPYLDEFTSVLGFFLLLFLHIGAIASTIMYWSGW